jgi:hypothetical protein
VERVDIPAHLRAFLGQNMQGPNCWNATQLWHDPGTPVRYVPDTEMERWLEERTVPVPRLCEPAPGDIMVLRTSNRWYGGNTNLVHTAVYSHAEGGRRLMFHKVGIYCPGRGWELLDEAGVCEFYAEGDLVEWRRYVGQAARPEAA